MKAAKTCDNIITTEPEGSECSKKKCANMEVTVEVICPQHDVTINLAVNVFFWLLLELYMSIYNTGFFSVVLNAGRGPALWSIDSFGHTCRNKKGLSHRCWGPSHG